MYIGRPVSVKAAMAGRRNAGAGRPGWCPASACSAILGSL